MRRNRIIVIALLFCAACNTKQTQQKITPAIKDSIYRYLDIGDAKFLQRNHINNYAESIKYYDSAVALTELYSINSNDTLLEDVYSSIARAYQGWGKKPEKTVFYYKKVVEASLNKQDKDGYPFWTLILADAYQGAKDSANAIKTLQVCETYDSLADRIYTKDQYYTEMAYVAALCKNYEYAQKLSNRVKNPELVTNEAIDFKKRQILTQCILHIYYSHTNIPEWIDSTRSILRHSTFLADSIYCYKFLISAFTDLNISDSVVKYEDLLKKSSEKFGSELDNSKAENSYLTHEVTEAEKSKTEAEKEKKAAEQTLILVAIIASLLVVVIGIFLYNRRKIAAKNKELAALNKELDYKATQNELMVKEMHHRVKNNLTLIYSLLEMQGRKTDNEETKEQLLAARQRIESIAITHEQLYANQDNGINMKEYVSNLVKHILNGQASNVEVIPEINIEENIVLNTNTCLPLAMLINEWLTNTVKYAVNDNDKVVANINAYKIDNTVSLIFFDTGNVVKDDNIKTGLGSKIINLLCKQINATLNTTHNDKAFHYKVNFNI